ncbi:unnamed protein product [Amaranthus hypochondriacus]
MSMNLKKSASNTQEQYEEQSKKIEEVRKALSPIPEKLSKFCSDSSTARYLRARNWHVKKATKMMKESLKWRLEYKPEKIRWEDIASEADSGKIYRSTSVDKKGRPILVMCPSRENSKSVAGQIRYLVYCMENAILNLPPDQEQMVWLIDFWNFNITNVSFKSAKETAHVLQNHYPERLGIAILYNPPRFFEQFYKVVKPFLEPKTRNKVKFVYADDMNSKKIMEELFDMEQLESCFGGKRTESFDIQKYAQRMKEDDEKMCSFWEDANGASVTSNVNGLINHECSTSDDDDLSQQSNGRHTPSAEGSAATISDVTLSVATMNLKDSEDAKA